MSLVASTGLTSLAMMSLQDQWFGVTAALPTRPTGTSQFSLGCQCDQESCDATRSSFIWWHWPWSDQCGLHSWMCSKKCVPLLSYELLTLFDLLTSPESKDDRYIFRKTRSSKCKIYVLQLMSKPWHHHICVLSLIVHCNLMFRPLASFCWPGKSVHMAF